MSSDTRTQRKLAAVLAADLAGYGTLIGADEEGTLARLKAVLRDVIQPAITRHRGRLFKTTGDGFLAEFSSVVNALCASVEIQQEMVKREAGRAPERRFAFRIGLHLGDVVVEGQDLIGDGVNIAARLESLAEPGGIAVSQSVRDQARGRHGLGFDDQGEKSLKHVAEPVRVFFVRFDEYVAAPEALAARRAVSPLPLAAGIAALALLAAGSYALMPGESARVALVPGPTQVATAPAEDIRPAMIVLPFANLSNDPEQEYFADGFTEDVATALSRVPGFMVMARNTAFTFKGKPVDAQQIGRDLGVRYVLEGSVRKQGDRLRFNTQLVETATGKHVWAEKFDRPFADIFTVQDELVDRIVGMTAANLKRREGERALAAPPEKLEAYELTMRARLLRIAGGKDNILESRRLLDLAIARDPNYAPAYSFLTFSLSNIYQTRWNDEYANLNTLERVVAASRKAVELAPDDGLAHISYSLALRELGRWNEMEAEVAKAFELAPNDLNVLNSGAVALLRIGRFQQAESLVRRALLLDPLLPPVAIQSNFSHVLFQQEKYSDAAQAARACIARSPTSLSCRIYLVSALGKLGQLSEAQVAVDELQRLSPGYTIAEERRLREPQYQNPADLERILDGLRKAGLPEQ